MKPRNFHTKTGHHASDKYFKNYAPLWFDSDMLKSFIFGFLWGAGLSLLFCM